MIEILKEAASVTPDPERAFNNLFSFVKENPMHLEQLRENIRSVSMLFSHSQFLSNYCITYADDLFVAIGDIKKGSDRNELEIKIENETAGLEWPPQRTTIESYMNAVRRFRIKEILKISLRDILKKADLIDIMLEMSCLADVIINYSLKVVRNYLSGTYGMPQPDRFSVIALGKLGAEELNFSSDVDLIYVYDSEDGETSGILSGKGIKKNRLSKHEYYCKVGEELSKFLSHNTDAGFAYRVDLRLRPEGQKGSIALALHAYETYYESWGRAWERAMLLRARPIAGDAELGREFMDMISPFVYRKYLDFSSIDEIRKLKIRIDSAFKKSDIKRGYGGIREIEFFAQALQLMYAGRERLLREKSVLKALHLLLQKGLIGQADYGVLTKNYRYFRTLEHRLQQVNDLQTHAIPSGEAELNSLSRKMGFESRKEFIDDLEIRRMAVRKIYDSLFGPQKEEVSLSGTLFDEEYSDSEIKDMLASSGLKDAGRALRNLKSIRDCRYSFQTLRGRGILSEILPLFVDSALKTDDPDMSLNNLQSFVALISTNESYLEIFSKNRELVDLLTYLFSMSAYLSRMLMTRPEHLEMIGWQKNIKKSLRVSINEMQAEISKGEVLNNAIRRQRQIEEIRLGLLFLQKKIGIEEVIRGLSGTAEAILSVCLEHISTVRKDLSVISFGKLGGREITFGSDLDLIFVCSDEVTQEATYTAEKFLRILVSYTRDGVAYSVDTRLRPEGTKGPLVSTVESFNKYYLGAAAFWEFQALLKARPVAGNIKTALRFIDMAREVLIASGPKISASDIKMMRERIMRERAKENEGYDIKLGPGGIEDIEFAVQYLQLKNCNMHNRLLVQNTLTAVHRLSASGVILAPEAVILSNGYIFFRTIESLLRLRGEDVLRKNAYSLKITAEFLSLENSDMLIEHIEHQREAIIEIVSKYMV